MSVWFLGARGSPERSSHDQELGSRVPDVWEPSQGRELAELMGMVSFIVAVGYSPQTGFWKVRQQPWNKSVPWNKGLCRCNLGKDFKMKSS